MKLSYLAELVAVFAFGMALAGAAFRASAAEERLVVGGPESLAAYSVREIAIDYCPVFLSGVAVAGGIGLLVERLRRRTPAKCGEGRWVWAVSAIYVLLCSLQSAAVLIPDENLFLVQGLVEWSDAYCAQLGMLLIATWLTTRLARVQRTPGGDAREWSGRLVAGAFVIYMAASWAHERWPMW